MVDVIAPCSLNMGQDVSDGPCVYGIDMQGVPATHPLWSLLLFTQGGLGGFIFWGGFPQVFLPGPISHTAFGPKY